MDLFFNSKYQTEFEARGYTLFSLLNKEDIHSLQCLYKEVKEHAGVASTFYTSIWSENKAHRKAVSEGIKGILLPLLQKEMHSIQSVFANFMVKESGEDSSLVPHQDWSFVQEPIYESMTVWIPLIDVDHTNGNLQVLPKSHHDLQNFVRPRFGESPFDRQDASKKLIDIPMRAGEALLLNSRLIHASPPNLSNRVRVAVSIVIAPEVAPLKHWFIKNNMVEELNVDQTFFLGV
jgi:ectoine hydroxylase-related dioxygenase (phytanoyl-CoA dioxygenase family)